MQDSPESLRLDFIERLRCDLLGPDKEDEVLSDKPTARYLTGILFAQGAEIPSEENEEFGVGDDDAALGSTSGDSVSLTQTKRPASMGFSFSIASSGKPTILAEISAGCYKRRWLKKEDATEEEAPEAEEAEEAEEAGTEAEGVPSETEDEGAGVADSEDDAEETGELTDEMGDRKDLRWERQQFSLVLPPIEVGTGGPQTISLESQGMPGMELYLQSSIVPDGIALTAVLINTHHEELEDWALNEENAFFQVELKIRPGEETKLIPRPVRTAISSDDPADDESGDLIYRNIEEYAVGHTCSASWELSDEGTPLEVSTEWLPQETVPAVSPEGDPVFEQLRTVGELEPLSASWIAQAGDQELIEGLQLLPDCYEKWAKARTAEFDELPDKYKGAAKRHKRLWDEAIERMRSSIGFLQVDEDARSAFKFANEAMARQFGWGFEGANLAWRPFQLGFQLLVLKSLLDREDDHRSVMDLLWFPTGGGKTEAYLALFAAVIFYRRLHSKSENGDPDQGAGVAVIMRYTLRLLTTQQFERATRLICACDAIRRRDRERLGQTQISIGMWVGMRSTANRVKDARSDQDKRSQVIKKCPCCGERLVWPDEPDTYKAQCENTEGGCDLAGNHLPLWTVDDDIYRELPSLLVGTIDKFAQIARNSKTGKFFGKGVNHPPPDLILQDELHLITGPLGTIAAVYEMAIHLLCKSEGFAPKIIGSTATIKRARQQVHDLFNREVYQFPAPGLDADNSCFSVRDDSKPGRLYVGVTTAGRSRSFTLQAVSASLLQGSVSEGIPEERRDDYWTLIAYFNSLRDLGGAHVLMIDHVRDTMQAYASRREEGVREIDAPQEISSNLSQREIGEVLKSLENTYESGNFINAALATNMISVGMDISRLALMVVHGQPKTISEYIQVTSRVGRAKVPGLVVGVFNNNNARDHSHYETFRTWHSTLYRDVEATSVTPFSPRAQDKALHGVLVAIVRQLVAGMKEDNQPKLGPSERSQCAEFLDNIVQYATSVDPIDGPSVARKLESLLDHWEARDHIVRYWNDRDINNNPALMMSAEAYAALAAIGQERRDIWPTLNSMRDVEASVEFRLRDFYKVEGKENAE